MAFNFSPKTVTEGLVLALDAANPRSYVSGSTVWRDLTANGNSGSLINGPTFNSINGGSIIFDGVDDYAEIPNNSSLNSSIGTISIWFNYSTVTGIYGPAVLGKCDLVQSRNGYNIIITPQNEIYVQIKNASSQMNTNNTIITSNTWFNYVFSYSSGQTYSTYLNGSQSATGAVLSFSISSAQPMRLADSIDSFWGIFGGRIANVQIYNRALSPAEILQNYNALKGRFNLT